MDNRYNKIDEFLVQFANVGTSDLEKKIKELEKFLKLFINADDHHSTLELCERLCYFACSKSDKSSRKYTVAAFDICCFLCSKYEFVNKHTLKFTKHLRDVYPGSTDSNTARSFIHFCEKLLNSQNEFQNNESENLFSNENSSIIDGEKKDANNSPNCLRVNLDEELNLEIQNKDSLIDPKLLKDPCSLSIVGNSQCYLANQQDSTILKFNIDTGETEVLSDVDNNPLYFHGLVNAYIPTSTDEYFLFTIIAEGSLLIGINNNGELVPIFSLHEENDVLCSMVHSQINKINPTMVLTDCMILGKLLFVTTKSCVLCCDLEQKITIILAGSPNITGLMDGQCEFALFNYITGICYSSRRDSLFVCDSGNSVLRAIDLRVGYVSCIVLSLKLKHPTKLFLLDDYDLLFVLDLEEHLIIVNLNTGIAFRYMDLTINFGQGIYAKEMQDENSKVFFNIVVLDADAPALIEANVYLQYILDNTTIKKMMTISESDAENGEKINNPNIESNDKEKKVNVNDERLAKAAHVIKLERSNRVWKTEFKRQHLKELLDVKHNSRYFSESLQFIYVICNLLQHKQIEDEIQDKNKILTKENLKLLQNISNFDFIDDEDGRLLRLLQNFERKSQNFLKHPEFPVALSIIAKWAVIFISAINSYRKWSQLKRDAKLDVYPKDSNTFFQHESTDIKSILKRNEILTQEVIQYLKMNG
eukprot:TRINITY_DN633_c0_g1_i1.p1 TRINITY_DN633_c0_g1~~TRINITY_DN633_c0_g1_i1.p1  ORF type:complete len:703 (-),score=177.90 TRINITY_DN633_c0_g1_i1:790-2898(-)